MDFAHWWSSIKKGLRLQACFNRPGVAGAVLLTPLSLIISLRRRHAPMVGNGVFSHKIDHIAFFFVDSKSPRTSKLHYWYKSYGDFAEWGDFSYWRKW